MEVYIFSHVLHVVCLPVMKQDAALSIHLMKNKIAAIKPL